MNNKKKQSEVTRMPSIFLAHGSPLTLTDKEWMGQWNNWAKSIPKPESILMISAHWEQKPITISATETVPLYYDFYGFPEEFYQVQYSSPGAPELANTIEGLLKANWKTQRSNRGLDHGAYIPLMGMYPDADIPVLQISLPSMDPEELFKLGQKLEPLRNENVLIIGSGFITHNMRLISWESKTVPNWTKEFDSYIHKSVVENDVDSLLLYKEKAPHVSTALPTHEHFVPLIVAQGTNQKEEGKISFPIEGYTYGTFSKRSVQFN